MNYRRNLPLYTLNSRRIVLLARRAIICKAITGNNYPSECFFIYILIRIVLAALIISQLKVIIKIRRCAVTTFCNYRISILIYTRCPQKIKRLLDTGGTKSPYVFLMIKIDHLALPPWCIIIKLTGNDRHKETFGTPLRVHH